MIYLQKVSPFPRTNVFSAHVILKRLCAWSYLAVVVLKASSVSATTPTKLRPYQEIKLSAKPDHLTISKRGDFVYWLNQPDQKLQRISLADNQMDTRSVNIVAGSKDLCLSTDGATAYVAATTNEYGTYHSSTEQEGQIQTINLQDMTAVGTFKVPIDIYEMVCGAGNFLYVAPARGPEAEIHKIDPRKESILFSFGKIQERSSLRITPDLKRLYLGMNYVSPANMSAVNIPTDGRIEAATHDSPCKNQYILGGSFDLTPDGRYAINRAGTVLRLGAANAADMLFVTSLDKNLANVCDPASGFLWLTTEDGNLITYTYPGFEFIRTERLSHPGTHIVYDAAHASLWVAWSKNPGTAGGLDAYRVQSSASAQNKEAPSREKHIISPNSVAIRPAKLAPNQTIDLEAKLVRPTICPHGDYLYWLNQSEGQLQRLSLANNLLDAHSGAVVAGACDFCLSPDGSKAYIAATTNNYVSYPESQRGVVQTIDLQDMSPSLDFTVPIDLYEIACDSENFLYASSGSGKWAKIRKIDPRKQSLVSTSGWEIPGVFNLQITPDRRRLYLGTNGVSPTELKVINLKSGGSQIPFPYTGPSDGKYVRGGPFDITPDGDYAINRSGVVVGLSAIEANDMHFVAVLEPHLASACDPATGRLWVSTQDKRLITYKYPEFKLLKSESLTIYGESLSYDSAHKTLWIGWAKARNGLGGLDAYNLDSPAPYPNDITRAREPAVPPTKSIAPAAPVKERSLFGSAQHDMVIFVLLIACGATFLATLFVGWPPWRIPRPILFIGWFGWLGVLISLMTAWNLDSDLKFSRLLAGAGLIAGGLLWGVLRGKKTCYITYGVLMIGSFFSTVSKIGIPSVFTLIWIFAILYCGRKYWDDLV